jgi:hypothetical protein
VVASLPPAPVDQPHPRDRGHRRHDSIPGARAPNLRLRRRRSPAPPHASSPRERSDRGERQADHPGDPHVRKRSVLHEAIHGRARDVQRLGGLRDGEVPRVGRERRAPTVAQGTRRACNTGVTAGTRKLTRADQTEDLGTLLAFNVFSGLRLLTRADQVASTDCHARRLSTLCRSRSSVDSRSTLAGRASGSVKSCSRNARARDLAASEFAACVGVSGDANAERFYEKYGFKCWTRARISRGACSLALDDRHRFALARPTVLVLSLDVAPGRQGCMAE